MGLFDTISSFFAGSETHEEVNKNPLQETLPYLITSDYIENYKAFLKKNDIYFSYDVEDRLKSLSRRASEPMKLAVSGLFSSGKSTFLNAMLSDDILPSGFSPITSKITYLRYGNEPRLEITYRDGREEFAAIENIEKYVSQQSENIIKNIDLITLYFPAEILKKIIFVDTPGFNSPNKMDDNTTDEIMKHVDGIIWLTMISNAGKKSEIEILEKYFRQYSQKSICIVNHKDEIDDDDEVNEFIIELKEDTNFSKYFSDIIPISALQALESRKKNHRELALKIIKKFTQSIERDLELSITDNKFQDAIINIKNNDLVTLEQKFNDIKKLDLEENKELLKKSNILSVFTYIEKEIMPKANDALSFSLRKEMASIKADIIEHYNYLVNAIEELEKILEDFSQYEKSALLGLYGSTTKNATRVLRDIDILIDVVSDVIYRSFTLVENGEFYPDGNQTFFTGTPTGEWIDVYMFDGEYIWNQLDDNKGEYGSAVTRLEKSLDKLQNVLFKEIEKIQETLENNINLWKNKYSEIKEYSKENLTLHMFALESFEIFINDFENQAIYFIKDLQTYNESIKPNFTYFNNMINSSFRTAFYYQKSIEKPSKENIKNILEIATGIEIVRNYLVGNDSIFIERLQIMEKDLSAISTEKIKSILPHKKQWKKKIKLLSEYK